MYYTYMLDMYSHVPVYTCIHVRRYVPDFWLLYKCYLDGLEGLEQTTDFIHTEILGKLKLQNLDKTQRLNISQH